MTPDPLTDDDRLLLALSGERPAVPDDDASAELRDAVARLDGVLTRDAARQSLPPAHGAARAVLHAMRATTVARDAAVRRPRKPLRLPGWVVYPASAAAVLTLAMAGWWYTVHARLAADPVAVVDAAASDPLLTLRGRIDADDPMTQDDDSLARQFDSIIIEQAGGGDAERQLAAMKFLEESVQ